MGNTVPAMAGTKTTASWLEVDAMFRECAEVNHCENCLGAKKCAKLWDDYVAGPIYFSRNRQAWIRDQLLGRR